MTCRLLEGGQGRGQWWQGDVGGGAASISVVSRAFAPLIKKTWARDWCIGLKPHFLPWCAELINPILYSYLVSSLSESDSD